MVALSKGDKPSGLVTDDKTNSGNGVKTVPYVPLTPILITKDNAVKEYASKLDPATDGVLELDAKAIDDIVEGVKPDLREALDLGAARTAAFAREAKSHLVDFETELVPGLFTGVHYVPVQRVGAYLPAGRFPILASAFMFNFQS